MSTPKPLDTPDFHRLGEYFDALNQYLAGIGGNLVFSFVFSGFDLGEMYFDAKEIIYLNESDMRHCEPYLSERTASDLMNSVNLVMDRTNPAFDDASLPYRMHRAMFQGIWERLQGCVEL